MSFEALPYYKQQIIFYNYKKECKRIHIKKYKNWSLFKFLPACLRKKYEKSQENKHLKKANALAKKWSLDFEPLETTRVGEIKARLFEINKKIYELTYSTFQLDWDNKNNIKSPKRFFAQEYKSKTPFKNKRLLQKNWLIFKKENVNDPMAQTRYQFEKYLKDENPHRNDYFGDEDLKSVVEQYKIHLMPKKEKNEETMQELLNLLKNNRSLQKKLVGFKIGHDPRIKKDCYGATVPSIVMYIKPDKEKAQCVLDILKQNLNAKNGSNKRPRYNRKVNSLIYYANGDTLIKRAVARKKVFSEWFDRDGIHYSSQLVKELGLPSRKLNV